MKTFKFAMIFAAAIALATAVNARAGETPVANPFFGVLSTATSVELPAKAAELVAKADAKNLQQTTIDVVKAAVGLNPAAAAVIVGAIAQSTPEMAATAAATAISLVPSQAVAIARAAAAAAPKQAGKIVEAICRMLPATYQKIATAVAEVVPGAGREILAGIAAAIPTLKDSINNMLAGYVGGAIPSVSTVLEKIAQGGTAVTALALANPMTMPRGPTVSGVYIPPSQTPTNRLDAASGGQVPATTNRNYATP